MQLGTAVGRITIQVDTGNAVTALQAAERAIKRFTAVMEHHNRIQGEARANAYLDRRFAGVRRRQARKQNRRRT